MVESTANVEYILTLVQRRWGEDYIIVTNDGLQLEDSPATQGTVSIIVNVLFYNVRIIIGITFWKSPRRNIYAIHKSQKISIVSAGKHPLNIMDSDDDDFEPPPNSKRTKTETRSIRHQSISATIPCVYTRLTAKYPFTALRNNNRKVYRNGMTDATFEGII